MNGQRQSQMVPESFATNTATQKNTLNQMQAMMQSMASGGFFEQVETMDKENQQLREMLDNITKQLEAMRQDNGDLRADLNQTTMDRDNANQQIQNMIVAHKEDCMNLEQEVRKEMETHYETRMGDMMNSYEVEKKNMSSTLSSLNINIREKEAHIKDLMKKMDETKKYSVTLEE